jgi:hypothetical protein
MGRELLRLPKADSLGVMINCELIVGTLICMIKGWVGGRTKVKGEGEKPEMRGLGRAKKVY